MAVLLSLIGFVIAFALIAVGANVLFFKTLQRSVVARHAALDEIMRTGSVPHIWRRGSLTESGTQPPSVTSRDLRRLARLRRYVRQTSLVEDEDARKAALDQLARAGSDWREQLRSVTSR